MVTLTTTAKEVYITPNGLVTRWSFSQQQLQMNCNYTDSTILINIITYTKSRWYPTRQLPPST